MSVTHIHVHLPNVYARMNAGGEDLDFYVSIHFYCSFVTDNNVCRNLCSVCKVANKGPDGLLLLTIPVHWN